MRAVCDRQAIVWDTIERLAFRPADGNGWLWCYVRSLADLWGVEKTSVAANKNTEFTFKDLDIKCAYGITAVDHYGVSIAKTDSVVPVWVVDVSPVYCSRSAYYRPDEHYHAQDKANHLERDVETVLDGMIFHPRNHAHVDKLGIASPLGESALSSYEIRIGGGIENGFVFLTHLRYQFCLLSAETRQNERTRLIQLFTEAIRQRRHEKGQPIPPGELFGLKA